MCPVHIHADLPLILTQAMKRVSCSVCSAPALVTLMMLASVKESKGIPDPHQRELMLELEVSQQVGGRVKLTAAEQRMDSFLHKLKEQEMMASYFPPAMHFFKAKPLIQKSPLFKVLQKMPKGNKAG